jgi:hypothetical protein
MSSLNSLTSGLLPANTGIASKYLNPSKIVGGFVTPAGFTLSAVQLATPAACLAALQAACLADNPANRIFPIFNFIGMTDGSEATVVQKHPYGDEDTVREGLYNWKFQFRKGGLSLLNRMRRLNTTPDTIGWLWLDDNNILYGTSGLDATGAAGIMAIPQGDYHADPFKVNDGSKIAEYMIKSVFYPAYINDYVAYIDMQGLDVPTSVYGLQDLVIQATPGVIPASGSFSVQVFSMEPRVNLYSAYSVLLAAANLWKAANHSTGAVITITAVTADPVNQAFTVACTITAPPYPVTGNVDINLVGPTELATALIDGFESATPVSIPKT